MGFMGVHAAGQTACAYSGEPGWTGVNCNPNCNPELWAFTPQLGSMRVVG
jgi:hypothetical protein